jgi:hypothetical protein
VKLGGSLERRRGRRRSAGGEEEGRFSLDFGRGVFVALAAVVLGGWFLGYVVSTQFLFPAPPPPDNLREVPNVRGVGIGTAGERLAGAGLTLGPVDSLLHPSVSSGLVLGQSPLPGQVARPDTPVRVTISLGPQTRAVPDVRAPGRSRPRTGRE